MSNGLVIYQIMKILAAQPFVELRNFEPRHTSKHNKNPQLHTPYKLTPKQKDSE
jgi:hypothetical protein